MLTKRRAREINMQTAMRQQMVRVEASKRGAIAVLAFFGALGFLVAFMTARVLHLGC